MSRSTKLYIARHGQTEWNVAKRMQGHWDSPLTDLGVMQAEWLGAALKDVPFDAAYASSSTRALRTAQLIMKKRDVTVVARDQLREIQLGEWEGQEQKTLAVQDPEQFHAFWKKPSTFRLPSAETFFDAQRRVLAELDKVLQEHAGETILIVSHSVAVKLMMAHFEGRDIDRLWEPPYLHPTSLNVVEVIDGQPSIRLYGDTSHYREEVAER